MKSKCEKKFKITRELKFNIKNNNVIGIKTKKNLYKCSNIFFFWKYREEIFYKNKKYETLFCNSFALVNTCS